MNANASLFTVIQQILTHTPVWVWGLLAVITALGARQLFATTVSAKRLVFMPLGLGAYSLYGVAHGFGTTLPVLAGWLVGVGVVIAVGLALPVAESRRAQPLENGQLRVPGSVWPLVSMWAVFGIRYVSAVVLVMHPGWAHGSTFSLVMPMVYGAASGLFASRCLRTLLGGRPLAQLRLA